MTSVTALLPLPLLPMIATSSFVQVQKLGEGFDHPKLSVAAIFRPFRSLAPYIQFVGRILRVVVQNDPTHPDNYGHIVTHGRVVLSFDIKRWKERPLEYSVGFAIGRYRVVAKTDAGLAANGTIEIKDLAESTAAVVFDLK